jgi:hypothetical protein
MISLFSMVTRVKLYPMLSIKNICKEATLPPTATNLSHVHVKLVLVVADIGIPYWACDFGITGTYSERSHEARRLEASEAHELKCVE